MTRDFIHINDFVILVEEANSTKVEVVLNGKTTMDLSMDAILEFDRFNFRKQHYKFKEI